MNVYLVQHGEALSAEEDPQRPLREEGRAAAAKVAKHLAGLGTQLIDPPITKVCHSGKLRAQQTAEILAEALCLHVTPTVRDGMNPKDDARAIYEELAADRGRDGALLLVGHLPHLAHLAGLLLMGDAEKTPIRFVNAGVVEICPATAGWEVGWYVTPACVRWPPSST